MAPESSGDHRRRCFRSREHQSDASSECSQSLWGAPLDPRRLSLPQPRCEDLPQDSYLVDSASSHMLMLQYSAISLLLVSSGEFVGAATGRGPDRADRFHMC